MSLMEIEVAGGKETTSVLNKLWKRADSVRAKVIHHPFVLEILAQTLLSSSASKYIVDQVQDFTDVLSLSKNNRESRSEVPVPKYVQDLRNAFLLLNVESRRAVESFICGASRQVSVAAQTMKQVIEVKSKSENSSDALLTWTAVLRLRDFLEKTINRLPQANSGNNHCSAWLSTFAKSQFQACIALVEEELMRVLPSTMNATEKEQVQSIFSSVLQFELALLDSAYARNQPNLELTQQSTSPWHPSNIIFTTDFDVTCTIVDSSDTLVRAAEVAAMRSARDFRPGKLLEEYAVVLNRHEGRTRQILRSLENPEHSSDVSARLSGRDETSDDLVPGMDPLLRPSFNVIAKNISATSNEGSGDVPYDDGGLRNALLKLSDLEVLCNQDVMSAGVLSGSTKEEIMEEAKQVELRSNCPRVLQQLAEIGTVTHIVSANWSRDLIIGGLPKLPKGKLFVHCNDILFDDSGVSTGAIDMTVVDAFDKEEMLRALRKMYNYNLGQIANLQVEAPALTDEKAGKMLVYMGDSHTDLLGLLEADLGIVIGESPVTRKVISLYGIQLLPLVEASAYISLARLNGSQRSWRRSGILFEAEGWAHVEVCLFGEASPPVYTEPLKPGEEDKSAQQQPRFDISDVSQECLPPVNSELVQVAC